ncbi:AaceriAGL235Cp [[Ashbya] aceris (nom. inval.)]|nr:AaceriAGL235Cp [[Ashbya] aceris (nom. inval.)]
MDPLTRYKQAVQQRLDSAERAVSKVVHENTVLAQQLATREKEVAALQAQVAEADEALARAEERHSTLEEEAEILKDLFEHLCGVRVHKSYEDDTGLWFDASQGNRHGVMDYKLGFVKNGDSGETEVVYVPLLKRRRAGELRQLQAQLPAYLFDTLSFPLKSLHQFYGKLARCLSRSDAKTGATVP